MVNIVLGTFAVVTFGAGFWVRGKYGDAVTIKNKFKAWLKSKVS